MGAFYSCKKSAEAVFFSETYAGQPLGEQTEESQEGPTQSETSGSEVAESSEQVAESESEEKTSEEENNMTETPKEAPKKSSKKHPKKQESDRWYTKTFNFTDITDQKKKSPLNSISSEEETSSEESFSFPDTIPLPPSTSSPLTFEDIPNDCLAQIFIYQDFPEMTRPEIFNFFSVSKRFYKIGKKHVNIIGTLFNSLFDSEIGKQAFIFKNKIKLNWKNYFRFFFEFIDIQFNQMGVFFPRGEGVSAYRANKLVGVNRIPPPEELRRRSRQLKVLFEMQSLNNFTKKDEKIKLENDKEIIALSKDLHKGQLQRFFHSLTNLDMGFGSIEQWNLFQVLPLSSSKIVTIPIQIQYCISLTELLCPDNCLMYIPPEIGYCKNLSILNLYHNKLRTIPKEIENLESLKILNLSFNKIKKFPKLKKCFDLENLEINGNAIKGEIPENIGEFKKLKIFNFSGNNISVVHENLGNCKFLEKLDCSRNNIEILPDSLGMWLSLFFFFYLFCFF